MIERAVCVYLQNELSIENIVIEHKFHPKRRWKFDVALLDQMIAVEIEGGIYSKGRHTRPTGFIKDMEKYNSAAVLGWKVLRYSTKQAEEMNDIVRDLMKILPHKDWHNSDLEILQHRDWHSEL